MLSSLCSVGLEGEGVKGILLPGTGGGKLIQVPPRLRLNLRRVLIIPGQGECPISRLRLIDSDTLGHEVLAVKGREMILLLRFRLLYAGYYIKRGGYEGVLGVRTEARVFDRMDFGGLRSEALEAQPR
ncbi:hypothetical protein KOW79_002848 [Hemibagrus wyckioides]|uniref:Uncharacterized protein n=1 Tax=Hemibagrus wyckioides TaxID=337641 RepID=A0A9D3P5G1_9TELE|nr:hypothetical protein KOW79_002848 [Hemibagrus wyckioides]